MLCQENCWFPAGKKTVIAGLLLTRIAFRFHRLDVARLVPFFEVVTLNHDALDAGLPPQLIMIPRLKHCSIQAGIRVNESGIF